jgi:uncharacterized protein (TIGR01777 family)
MAAKLSRILISGASGPVGAALVPFLEERGCRITRLTRGPAGDGQISWDPSQPIAPEAVSGFDAVIHLAGESIAERWTAAKKAKIVNSRKLGTGNLARAVAQAKEKPRVFVSASAVGYYGDRGDEVLREDSPSGKGFAAEICREWEAATAPATQAGIRTVQMRIGMVLSPKGGGLAQMLPPFRMGVGGNIGNGRQWTSWIDVHDLTGAIYHTMTTESLQGPVNAVAPNAVTNAEFTRTLAEALSRPAFFHVPAFAVKLLFGQMGEEILLSSLRVEPAKLLASGYAFRFPALRSALMDVLGK